MAAGGSCSPGSHPGPRSDRGGWIKRNLTPGECGDDLYPSWSPLRSRSGWSGRRRRWGRERRARAATSQQPWQSAAFSAIYRCDPSFQRPFSHSRVRWNAAEMRGINYISVSNKWFNSSTSEVGLLLLHLWVRWKSTCRGYKKKIECDSLLFTFRISESEKHWGLSSPVAHLTGCSFALYFSHLLFKTRH